MNLLLRLLFPIALLLPLLGCQVSANLRNAAVQDFANTRFERLQGELKDYYDRLERMDEARALQAKLRAGFDTTCFSRQRGTSICTDFKRETNAIFEDPLGSVSLDQRYASFKAFMASSHETWKGKWAAASDEAKSGAGFSHALPRTLQDQGVAYYGLVDQALADINEKAQLMCSPQHQMREMPLLPLVEITLFLGAFVLLWFLLKNPA